MTETSASAAYVYHVAVSMYGSRHYVTVAGTTYRVDIEQSLLSEDDIEWWIESGMPDSVAVAEPQGHRVWDEVW